jgi:nitroreductase
MVYASTAHNRSVYASGAVAPSGYEKPQSAYGLCAVFLRHIFVVAGMLRIPLSQPQKRHIQPERYAKYRPNFFAKYLKKRLTGIKILGKIIFVGGNIINENETIKIIKQRRSIRQFSDKQISEKDLNTSINAGLYDPAGGTNFEEYIYFTIIQNQTILNKVNLLAKKTAKQSSLEGLKELGNNENSNCLYNAPPFIIISVKKQSKSAVYDCSALTQNMLLAAESIGLGSCWLGFPLQAFDNDKGMELIKELKIPHGFKPITSMVIGYKKIMK